MDVPIVLSLLRSKNRCLERFLSASEEFKIVAEQGDFSAIDRFHESREAALKALDLFDRKLSESLSPLPPAARTAEAVAQVEALLAEKDLLVQRILVTDQAITRLIEREKESILKRLRTSGKESAVVRKFKSTWVPEPGESLDKKL